MLYEKIGRGAHPCHWCGVKLRWAKNRIGGTVLEADHLDNDSGNNDSANLVPSCHNCNSKRHRKDLIGEGEPTIKIGLWRVRAVMRSCAFCNEGFPAYAKDTRPGRYRYCSRGCARRDYWRQRRAV